MVKHPDKEIFSIMTADKSQNIQAGRSQSDLGNQGENSAGRG
jgi:hypothetical protein